MAIPTRTINPLHFEDLEPHRFEDLVRQLVYDFREWTALEATGRQGSDDGFDARGWERVAPPFHRTVTDEDEPEEEATAEIKIEDRVWLIQCKREKTITPKKLSAYLNAINAAEADALYGLIFVAACDFSKKARDEYRKWCAEKGIAEFLIWGRAELEDILFQPKNDHLLFGYFGISLQIKRRSARAALRSMLATKRQTIKYLGEIEEFSREPVLLRDPEADSYPDSDKIADFDERPLWRVYDFVGHYHAGIKILVRTHLAYLADDGVKWDFEARIRTNSHHDDPWPVRVEDNLDAKAHKFWNEIPERNRATLEIVGFVRYEDILAIDEDGDEMFPHPHIYLRFDPEFGPFQQGVIVDLAVGGRFGRTASAEEKDRVEFFPKSYPDVEERA